MRSEMIRHFHSGIVRRSCKGGSSQRWLQRQANDPYVKLAQSEGYRARSAYKLKEIQDKFGLLKPGKIVIECGAAPGAWTQVAAPLINASGSYNANKPSGRLIGCDLLHIENVTGVNLLPFSDFTNVKTQDKILDLLKGEKADLVMSDMAPNASGSKAFDHDAIVKLVYAALRFGMVNSVEGADFLCKLWGGVRQSKMEEDLRRFYKSLEVVKPKSSRKDSGELFLLARGFRGLQNN